MTLAAGSRLGPYEILAPIGAGGMGEVYRARDPRLGREVAIKVLPASLSADADRLRRFEQEARAAGVLNHPNITAVYDIGTSASDGAPYVVQELLEGETLRAELAGGRLPPRKAIEYSLQIASGLAAAHEKGIVHRDLKPENLFVTNDGRVKILDFGLAKLTHPEREPGRHTNLPTAAAGTEPGVVLGTLGYMSPEQVRGRPADARSDIFSFGAILYEMLSGRRAFHGDSAADTMSAILREDPPDLSVTGQNVSSGLERIVRHCLEKNPERRFQAARDLAFSLDALTGVSGPRPMEAAAPSRRRKSSPLLWAAAGRGAARPRLLGRPKRPRFAGSERPAELSAHHVSSGQRRGRPVHVRRAERRLQRGMGKSAGGDLPRSRRQPRIAPLGIPNANVLSVSSTDELAVLLKKTDLYGAAGRGTLARVPIGGGAPRQIADDVYEADWSPDGKELAVLRRVDGKRVIEYPIGTRLGSADTVTWLRISPDGSSVAVVDDSESSSIVTLDRAGKRRVLARGYIYVDTLAWQPSGKEIWFDAVALDPGGAPFSGIFAVDMAGNTRTVTRTVDEEVMHDVGRDGRILIEREIGTREILFSSGATSGERDLSWFDQSTVASLSRDGKAVLFNEFGEAGGPKGSVYLRTTDGAPAVRLGDGSAQDLSPDGRWALAMASDGKSFTLLPTGAGESRTLPVSGMEALAGSFVPPDGKRIAFPAIEPGHSVRGYLMDVAGGKPRAFTGEGLTGEAALSPNGTDFALNGPDNRPRIYSFSGAEPRPLPGLEAGDIAIQWSSDGRTLFLVRFGELPTRVYRYDLASGRKTLWKELLPADRTGLVTIDRVAIAADGNSYAYTANRVTNSDLYVVTGWR